MTPEQNLIQQIIRVLENNQLENNSLLEDYAAQYAELCTLANSRLQRCAEYLNKGLLTEAVYEARIAPDLLEFVQLLQFDLAKKWRNVCTDLELPQAPLLHTEIIASLAQACSQAQSLDPLLKEFRSLIYQGLHHPAIGVLRKIRALDPENSSWITNLRTFEEEELPEWLHRAEVALHKMDLPVLREVSEELNHPWRVVPAPPEVLYRLRKALLTEQAENFQAEGSNLLQRLGECLGQGNGEAVQEILQRSAALEQEEAFFLRPPNWDLQLQTARSWLEKFQAEQKMQQEFQQQLTAMQEMLVKGNCQEIDLRHTWERLLAWNRPVPELLRQQVEEIFASLHQRRLRKGRRILQIVTTTVVLLSIAIVVTGFWLWQRGRQREIWADLELDYQKADFVSLAAKLDGLQKQNPGFYQDLRVQALRHKLTAAVSEQGERVHLANNFFLDLEEIRRLGYQRSDAEIEAFLAGANDLLLTSNEKMQVENWKRSWLAWKSSKQREHNQAIELACQQISLARASQLKAPFADFAEEEQKINELENSLQELEPRLLFASEENRTAFSKSKTTLEEWQRELAQRQSESVQEQETLKAQTAEIKKITAEIYQSIPDLPLYQMKLLALKELSGGEMPRQYSLALEHYEAQSQALILQDFTMRQFPCTAEQEKTLRSLLAADGPGVGSVWEGDLQRCRQYLDNVKKARNAIQRLFLEQEEMHLLYYLDYKKKDAVDWQRLYIPQMLSSRVDTDNKGNASTLYWGNVYYAETAEDVPELVHSSKAFAPNGLNTNDYDLLVARKFQDSLCPQGKFLSIFIMDAKDKAEIDVLILENLSRLQNDFPDIELIAKTWLQKRLLNFLLEFFLQEIPESLEWADKINSLPTDVPWMNPAHPKTLAAVAEIHRAGRLYPDLRPIIERLQANRQLLANALSRRLTCVGILRQDADRRLQISRTVPGQGELWVLATRSAHTPPTWYILSHDGTSPQAEVLANCYDAQLLFTPLNTVLPKVKLPAEIKHLQRPLSLPVNTRLVSNE